MTPNDDPAIPTKIWSRIRAGLKAFWRWLLPKPKRSDPLAEFDEVFSPIDLEAAKKQLGLERSAHRHGSKELPDSRERNLDGPQSEIRQYVMESVSDAYRRANRELERLRDAVNGRSIRKSVEQILRMPAEVSEHLRNERRIAEGRIAEATRDLDWAEERIREYQERYSVVRGPQPKEKTARNRLIAVTLAVALFQIFANMFLFAQGMSRGLSAGLGLAILLAILDILFHLQIGKVAGKVQVPDPVNRALGVLFFALSFFTVAFYNLSVVHLRNSIRLLGFADGLERFGPMMLESPFGFSDAYSYLLLVIGVVCSASAVIAGWYWDEVIPVFRREGPRRDSARREIEYWEAEMAGMAVTLREESTAELDRLEERLSNNLQTTRALVNRMRRLRENLETFTKSTQEVFEALILFYRDENRLARSTDPPHYFGDKPLLDAVPPLRIDQRDLDELLERETRLKDQIVQQLPQLRREITEKTSGSSSSSQEYQPK